MIQRRNPAFGLAPEWGARVDDYRGKDHRRTYRTCCRCGRRRQVREGRLSMEACGDCQMADPQYMMMVFPRPRPMEA